jgi:uncharacterized repeat protein (TIGR01451 family)
VENIRVTDEFSPLFVPGSVTWCRPDDPDCDDPQPGNIDHTISLPAKGKAVYRASGTLGPTTRLRLFNSACAKTPEMKEAKCGEKRIPIETTPPPVDLKLDAVIDGPVTAGGIATVTLTTTNNGTGTATGVALTEDFTARSGWIPYVPFPPGSGCSTLPSGAVTCRVGSGGSLGPGESVPIDIPYRVVDECSLTEVAGAFVVAANEQESDDGNNSASVKSSIVWIADLSVSKTPAAASAPQTVSFTERIENLGPYCACDVVLSDPTPAGLTSVPPSSPPPLGCDFTADGIRCSRLCPGDSRTLTVVFAIPPPGTCEATSVTNTATVTFLSMDPVLTNNSATATVDIAPNDLSITKTSGVSSVLLGNPMAYTLTLTNQGSTALTGARVQDTFPPELLNALWCRDAGAPCSPSLGGPIDDTLTLAAGATATYRIAGLVSPLCAGSLSNSATVTGPTGFVDCSSADNAATDNTACVAPFGVTAWCMGIDGVFLEGEEITKTFLLINGGPADQADNPGDEFTDALPAGLTLVSAAASSGVVSTAGNAVTWNGAIPVGGRVTITINATIDAGTAGTTICNQATIAFDADGNGTNESGGLSDDPNTPTGPDACCFRVFTPAEIPTLSTLGLIAFALLTALLAWARLRTQRP